MLLLALWFVLPALFQRSADEKPDDARAANLVVYQDQYHELDADLRDGLLSKDQYQLEKEALERRLLEDVRTDRESGAAVHHKFSPKIAYAVAIGIPIAAIGFYFMVGNPKAINSSAAASTGAPPMSQPGSMSPQQISANVEKLAQKLQQNPNDAQGWLMLARSYMMLEKFSEAADAYDHVTKLSPNDADAWADYAEAQAMANDRNLAGKPTEALNRALQIDPKNQKALDLAGSAAFQSGDYQKAIGYWQKLLTLLQPGSEELRTITEQIGKAKELAGSKGSR